MRCLQVTRQNSAPLLAKHGIALSPVKLWVLAMLAPERGCAWLRSRRKRANLTGLARDASGMPQVGTEEQVL
jgi:hypothetical protein